MIVVRNCFVARPGNASKLAALFKEVLALTDGIAGMKDARVLTDLTGDFNRVVLEQVAENVGAFEQSMKDYETNPAVREKMKGYTELYITGSREILKIV